MHFVIVTPVQTGLWMSISYAVNKIPRLAMDLVPNSVDHLKDNPCRPMSNNCTESLSTVLNPWQKPAAGTQNMNLPCRWHILHGGMCKTPYERVPELDFVQSRRGR